MKNLFEIKLGTVALALLIGLTGCGRDTDTVADFDDVDLSQAEDLFDVTPQVTDDPILVRVEGAEIRQSELMQEVNMIMQRFQGQEMPPEQMAQMRDEVMEGAMENLIMRRLLINRVEAEGIEVDDAEIDEVIEAFRQQIPPGMNLEDQLAEAGMDMVSLRENLRQEMAVNKMLEAKVDHILEPSEEEIAAFHEEHRDDYFAMPESVQASHILINTTELDEEGRAAARQRIEELRQQLAEGADFAELAQAVSDCPSGAQGGDLGRFGRGQMVPEFEEAAFTQEIGEVGDVIETQFGFHLIKVSERHDAGVTDLAESREQIAAHLSQQSRQDAMRDYIDQIREEADIEFMQLP